MTQSKARRRSPGTIDELPNGALRVRVDGGSDPITRRRHRRTQIIPAGPGARAEAELARARMVTEALEQRAPRTKATVSQLLDRYLDMIEASGATLETYRGYVDKHVRPFIGKQKIAAIDADILESLYAEMKRCRDHCSGRPTAGHECKPLSNSGVRQIHFILSGAYRRAVRWRWISTNPVEIAKPPSPTRPDPRPPSAAEAARILTHAWRDPDWGTLIWLTMTTGSRRGEICALRWRHFDLDNRAMTVRRSITQFGARTEEKDTKTHQQRRIVLDVTTTEIMREHFERCTQRAAGCGEKLSRDAFVFSPIPDGTASFKPNSLTQRYRRQTTQLGIETHLHCLRHYSATELISAGVDVRTVAGRLGHGGGGATTLKVYSAWLSESDQRASKSLFDRMPLRPDMPLAELERALANPRSAPERIAGEFRALILDGSLASGYELPTTLELCEKYSVARATVNRAMALLREWGLVETGRGLRARVKGDLLLLDKPAQLSDRSDADRTTEQQLGTATSARPIRHRLAELDDLLRDGVITADEHASRRAEVLREL